MTAGEYLKILLDEKEVSVAELCSVLGIRSRNTIYRLFKNYHGTKKTRELIDQIIENVYFTDDEALKLVELAGEKKSGNVALKARDILANLFEHEDSGGITFECDGHMRSLQKTLDKYDDGAKTLFIASLGSTELIDDIYSFLKERTDTKIYHFMSFSHNSLRTAYEMLAMVRISAVRNYVPVLVRELPINGIELLAENESGCRMMKLTEKKEGYIGTETEITRELYTHLMRLRAIEAEAGENLRRNASKVIDYIEVVNESLVFDEGHTFYLEGAPCFGNLGFEIMYDMFCDINYFGYPREHPYVQRLIDLIKTRQEKIEKDPNSKKYFVFDEMHIIRMLETGYSFDHVAAFNPMTREQRRRYFKGLIETASEHPEKLQFRFLKRGSILSPFVYGIGSLFYINYSDTPYFDGYSIMLREKGVFKIMDAFIRRIWESYTVSDSESIAMLKRLMKEYLG